MAESKQFQSVLCFDKFLTILDGQTTSDGIDLAGTEVVAMRFPAGFDGTTMQILSGEKVDGTYISVKNTAGTVLAPTPAANSQMEFVPSDLVGVRFLKVVCGAQTGDVQITLVTRPLA